MDESIGLFYVTPYTETTISYQWMVVSDPEHDYSDFNTVPLILNWYNVHKPWVDGETARFYTQEEMERVKYQK